MQNYVTKTIRVKNIHHERCLNFVQNIIQRFYIKIIDAQLDQISIEYDKNLVNFNDFITDLENNGFGLIYSREQVIVEKIKKLVMDLIYEMNFKDSIIQKSEHISSKLNMSYEYLSKLFKKNENITLEKFIIGHKLNRVKELINEDELSISEISYMMDYSSVQYLSTQFKKEFGKSPSEYKKEMNNK